MPSLRRPAPGRSRLALLPALTLLAALVAALPGPHASATPLTRTPSRSIERFAPFQPQTICSPTAKPGTVALRSLIVHGYGGTGDYGIIRNCSIGGRSEHKEGRAWDWKVNAANPTHVRQVNDMLRWILATDRYGNRSAQARRLGVMYLIWNRRMWVASSNSWRPYTGADPHTNHLHVSLGWAGALKRTSYWTGFVAGTVRPPAAPRPAAPRPTGPQPLTTTALLAVPGTTAAGVSSRFLVLAGRRYLLKATGVYRYGPGVQLADTECAVRPSDGSWQRGSQWEHDGTFTGPRGHLDLRVEDREVRWVTSDGAPCDEARHGYSTVIEPTATGPLTLRVVDDSYSDNGGGLHVSVMPLSDADRR